MHEQATICRQLFAGHVVGSQPMKRKKKLYQMIINNIIIPRVPIGYELAIIISYPTSVGGIIVLLKMPTKYQEFFLRLLVKTTDFHVP